MVSGLDRKLKLGLDPVGIASPASGSSVVLVAGL